MIYSSQNIAASAAFKLVESARDHAGAHKWDVAIAVVDVQGVAVASLRMDGVPPPVLDFAADKAFTAATMRKSTTAYFERMSSVPALGMGLTNRHRLLVWGGGLPIIHKGAVVGGIGVSGAAQDEDIACARAALEALGFAVGC